MKYGYKDAHGLMKCANCETVVGKDDKIFCDFCYKCGNPITINAVEKRGEEYTNQRIKLVYEIKKAVDNGENINKILNDYIKSINED